MLGAENGETAPCEYYQRGIANSEDPACDGLDANGDADTSEIASDHCQAVGGDLKEIDTFYAVVDANDGTITSFNVMESSDHADATTNIEAAGFTPRGAGWIMGADQYYWFSKIVYGDLSMFKDPKSVATDATAYWMSGMMRWMIPMNGQPAPHNIILGQWEPTFWEADQGIVDGFGAVSALLFGASQCGMAGHPIAKARTDIYNGIIDLLEGADDGKGKAWKARDTIFTFESSDCANMARADFPDSGDYSSIPQFATPVVSMADWTTGGDPADTPSDTCFVVRERTDYIVWEKNAFRQCMLDAMADR